MNPLFTFDGEGRLILVTETGVAAAADRPATDDGREADLAARIAALPDGSLRVEGWLA